MMQVYAYVDCRLPCRPEKFKVEQKLVFFGSCWFNFRSIVYRNLWSASKNVLGVSVVSKEIECADRIVYGNRTYKAFVVSARASDCVFSLYWSRKIVLINSDIVI